MPNDHTQTVATLRARLTQALQPLALEIHDDSARHAGHVGAAQGGGHFHLRAVSAAFIGQSRLQRQRLVYDHLADLMKRDIHALSMTLLAPDEVSRSDGDRPVLGNHA